MPPRRVGAGKTLVRQHEFTLRAALEEVDAHQGLPMLGAAGYPGKHEPGGGSMT